MLLSFEKTKNLLLKYNIPITETKVIQSEKEAFDFFDKKKKVALKIFSSQVLHRTEKGLIKSGIKTKKELKESIREIKKNSQNILDKKILIQKQEEGIELVLGVKRDETFGPVLMFGLGGIFVEILKDVSFGIVPLTKKESMEMIKGIKGYKILKGFRGNPSVDLEKISEILLNLSSLAEKENVKEIDLNPTFIKGDKIKVVDFKIIV